MHSVLWQLFCSRKYSSMVKPIYILCIQANKAKELKTFYYTFKEK